MPAEAMIDDELLIRGLAVPGSERVTAFR